LRFFKEFVDKTGIKNELASCGLPQPGSNRGFNPVDIIESFWVTVWIGGTKFVHTSIVRFDEALKDIYGWEKVPSTSTYTRFFRKFKQQTVNQVFGRLNTWFFLQIPQKVFTLDLDSTVMTRYGKQEGAQRGYNPKKPGRPSHHPLMAFIANTRMVANSWLRSGNTGTVNGANEFLDETQAILGHHKVGLLRADSGFFSGKFLSHIEEKGLNYIIAVRMNSVIKHQIQSLKSWITEEEGIEVCEFLYQAMPWHKSRRMVVVRQRIQDHPNAGGKYLFEMETYRHQTWVTNLSLSPDEVWRLYRQRADCENRIEELKYDFGLEGFCSNQFYATEAAFKSVMIAYNLMSLFRQLVLKFPQQPKLQTIRFKCFAIGSWIGKKYRNKVLKMSVPAQRRAWFDGLFSKIINFRPPFRFSD